MKSHNIQKFQKGGWIVTTNDNTSISEERSAAIYNQVLSNLQQIWLSDSVKWSCTGKSCYYEDTNINRKIGVFDIIINL